MKEALQLRGATNAVFLTEDEEHLYPDDAFECVHELAKPACARQVLSKTNAGFRWFPLLTDSADLVGLFAEAAAELIIRRYDPRMRGRQLWLVVSRYVHKRTAYLVLRGHVRHPRTGETVSKKAKISVWLA
ncbi:hypothetical protein [Pararhizobium qamdonense]|nr:hypothetical protein [Pararhizobium qamdonense]